MSPLEKPLSHADEMLLADIADTETQSIMRTLYEHLASLTGDDDDHYRNVIEGQALRLLNGLTDSRPVWTSEDPKSGFTTEQIRDELQKLLDHHFPAQ